MLTKVTGKPVDRVMSTFVDQPGLPLVSIDVRCTGNTAQTILTQERYVRDPRRPGGITTALADSGLPEDLHRRDDV